MVCLYFDGQIISGLTSGCHFVLAIVSFRHVPINILVLSYFLAQGVPDVICPFPALPRSQLFFQEGSAPLSGEWYLKSLQGLHDLALVSSTASPVIPLLLHVLKHTHSQGPQSAIFLHTLAYS